MTFRHGDLACCSGVGGRSADAQRTVNGRFPDARSIAGSGEPWPGIREASPRSSWLQDQDAEVFSSRHATDRPPTVTVELKLVHNPSTTWSNRWMVAPSVSSASASTGMRLTTSAGRPPVTETSRLPSESICRTMARDVCALSALFPGKSAARRTSRIRLSDPERGVKASGPRSTLAHPEPTKGFFDKLAHRGFCVLTWLTNPRQCAKQG